jgi:hypothetical protein
MGEYVASSEFQNGAVAPSSDGFPVWHSGQSDFEVASFRTRGPSDDARVRVPTRITTNDSRAHFLWDMMGLLA